MQFGLHGRVLVARAPDGVPVGVAARVCARGRADDAEHPLGRVLVSAAGHTAVTGKVVDDGLGVGAYVAKLDGAAAFGKEEEAVELLKEETISGISRCPEVEEGERWEIRNGRDLRRGLMDGAEDGLAIIG